MSSGFSHLAPHRVPSIKTAVGGFYHPFFVKDDPQQCSHISRDKQKNQSLQERMSSSSNFRAGIPTGASSITQQNPLFNAPGIGAKDTLNLGSSMPSAMSANRQLQPLDRSVVVQNYQRLPKTMEESKLSSFSFPTATGSSDTAAFPHQWLDRDSQAMADNTRNKSEASKIPFEMKLPYLPKAADDEPLHFDAGSHNSIHHHQQQQGMASPSAPFRNDAATSRYSVGIASRNSSAEMISMLNSSGAGASTIGWLLGGGVSLSDLKSVLQTYRQNQNQGTGTSAIPSSLSSSDALRQGTQQNDLLNFMTQLQQPHQPSSTTAEESTDADCGRYQDEIISLFGNDNSNSSSEDGNVSPTIFDV